MKSSRNTNTKLKLVTFAASAALTLGWQGPLFAASTTSIGTIPISGIAGPTCTITVSPDTLADELPIAADTAAHTVVVGSLDADCNVAGNYTLAVTTGVSCSSGAKLDGPGANVLAYSIRADNGSPAPDGTYDLVDLLATDCAAATARAATTTPVTSYLTTLAVNFTADTALAPGAYTDTITITMTTTY